VNWSNKKVFIETLYMQDTVDNRHKELYDYKMIKTSLIIDNSEIDELYHQVVLNKLLNIFSEV
jgi:hypothetical protein